MQEKESEKESEKENNFLVISELIKEGYTSGIVNDEDGTPHGWELIYNE